MKRTILSIFLSLAAVALDAQTVFIQSGSIEFERSINVRKQIEGSSYEQYAKDALSNRDRFYNSNFVMYFDSTRSLYKPLLPLTPFEMPWILGPAKENVVFCDYLHQTRQSHKMIFEDKYIIKDSLRRVAWRITDEKRTIAGFECRKAVGRICDSVYVTAFYTDEILTSGGPEGFDGLPGMILGLAIPRLYTTWFAKKVSNAPPVPQSFIFAAKAKPIEFPALQSLLLKSLKQWGKDAEKSLWWSLL